MAHDPLPPSRPDTPRRRWLAVWLAAAGGISATLAALLAAHAGWRWALTTPWGHGAGRAWLEHPIWAQLLEPGALAWRLAALALAALLGGLAMHLAGLARRPIVAGLVCLAVGLALGAAAWQVAPAGLQAWGAGVARDAWALGPLGAAVALLWLLTMPPGARKPALAPVIGRFTNAPEPYSDEPEDASDEPARPAPVPAVSIAIDAVTLPEAALNDEPPGDAAPDEAPSDDSPSDAAAAIAPLSPAGTQSALAAFAGQPDMSAGEALAQWLARFAPALAHLVLTLLIFMPQRLLALWLAAPLALAWQACHRPYGPRPARAFRGRRLWPTVEAIAWLALAVAPLAGWWLAMRLRAGAAAPPAMLWTAGGLVVTACALAAAGLRRSSKRLAIFGLPALWPWSLLGVVALAMLAGTASGSPPVSIQTWLAEWSAGLVARIEVAGAIAGLAAGAGAGVAAALALALWGRPWWLAAVALGLLNAALLGEAGLAWAPAWLAVACVFRFCRVHRLKWLTLAGAIMTAGALAAPAPGLPALLALVAWAAAWGHWGWRPDLRPTASGRTLAPFVALALGGVAALGLGAALVSLAGIGLRRAGGDWLAGLPDFAAGPGGGAAFALLVSAAGVWVAGAIIGRRDRSPLAGVVLLLALLQVPLAIAGGGPGAWGSAARLTLSWLLLGSLIVWRAGECAMLAGGPNAGAGASGAPIARSHQAVPERGYAPGLLRAAGLVAAAAALAVAPAWLGAELGAAFHELILGIARLVH